jgi:hypothetical protein
MAYSLRNDDRSKYNLQSIQSINDINRKKRFLNTISDFNSMKNNKAYFGAKKLKEEVEKNNKNNYNQNILPKSPYESACNQEKILFKEMTDIYNNKNEANKENKNNNNNTLISANNNEKMDGNGENNITYHFFDKNIKMPKRVKKYIHNDSNIYMNNNIMLKHNNYKNQNIKNRFRKEAKTVFNSSNNYNSVENELSLNKLKKYLSPDTYGNNYKKKSNNFDLNIITQDNIKLTNLLKKIPSNREFKDKSYDLIKYILDKLKNNALNLKSINNNCQGIYPANECNIFSKSAKVF